MPEFEEPEAKSSSKENYTPSTDASDKPRTRRRSGGFKTTPAPTNTSIGEVDPVEALKKEKLSRAPKSEPTPKKKKSAPRAEKPEPKAEPQAEQPRASTGNAQPSPETLAAVERVNARLNERKKERDARRTERDKNRSPRGEKKPAGSKKSSPKKAQSGGLISSILSFFGIAPKQPAKKQGGKGKPSSGRGQGDRPRGKGGNRSQGQNRRSSSKGRRSGGKGPRRNDRRGQDKNT